MAGLSVSAGASRSKPGILGSIPANDGKNSLNSVSSIRGIPPYRLMTPIISLFSTIYISSCAMSSSMVAAVSVSVVVSLTRVLRTLLCPSPRMTATPGRYLTAAFWTSFSKATTVEASTVAALKASPGLVTLTVSALLILTRDTPVASAIIFLPSVTRAVLFIFTRFSAASAILVFTTAVVTGVATTVVMGCNGTVIDSSPVSSTTSPIALLLSVERA